MNSEHLVGDDLVFAEESVTDAGTGREGWKLLIVDDEEEIHKITRLAMQDFIFEERRLTFVSAYSGEEAKTLLQSHPDTAIMLLDVVMESDHAGLEVARYVRETLCNTFVRIILRTGRPGQAPERKVISEYDINDYKEKTELTVQKLTTTIISALRSYRDLHIIDRNRRGLIKIINASAHLFEIQSLRQFANGVLTQLLSILNLDESSLYLHDAGFSVINKDNEFIILAATGRFEPFVDKSAAKVMPAEINDRLNQVLDARCSLFFSDAFVGYFPTGSGRTGILYLNGYIQGMADLDRDLLRLFSTNVSIAFKNLDLNSEIIETQKEVILTLGEVVESRSQEMANHVKRVAEVSYLLAMKAGLGEEHSEILRLASPMHDIGKVGVPDAILFKPGKPTPAEFEQIKPHAAIGYEILRKSRREIMEAAAVIARQHHEHWDGTGYPDGLSSENIHIYARITGLADVFDALSHKRVYKEAWRIEDVFEYIGKEKGKHFDPSLVDIFLDGFAEFVAINEQHPVEKND
jgi:response regulator RpfG family c-di-GMP phosphodiesterase